MSGPAELEQTRNELHALATQLLELTKTFEPTPHGSLALEPELITKAKTLVARAQTASDHAISICGASVEVSTIRTLLYLNALQSIPASGDITLTALAQATGATSALLERLLRVVVGTGFIHQSATGSYSHSRISRAYAEHEMTQATFELLYDSGVEILARLPKYLQERGADEPTSKTHNPLTWAAGQEGTSPFDIIGQDPARLRAFQKVMGSVGLLNPYTGFYDFGQLATDEPERAVFVDVGGGYGGAIVRMLEAHPNIRPGQCVLQDLASVIESASAHADLPTGVQCQAHDFHRPQPVRHARAYHLRAIAHDLGDDALVQVLQQIAPAMAPDSKVLIADNIVPEFGAKGFVALMDSMMMVIGGKERTEKNFAQVLDRAGLKLDAVHHAGGGRTYAIVEASLK